MPILYSYGLVPPAADTVTLPVEFPLQSTFVCDPLLKVKAVGSVTTTFVLLDVQLFASVTVTLYVPADNVLMSSLVEL